VRVDNVEYKMFLQKIEFNTFQKVPLDGVNHWFCRLRKVETEKDKQQAEPQQGSKATIRI
jgi:hypothetical protein